MHKLHVMLIAAAALLLADGPAVKTGQTTVYKTGDDGTYQRGVARSYTRDLVSGTVMDHATGLQWQDDAVGTSMNWEEACNYCAALVLDGKSDWYLPTRKELVSITDKSRVDPAIDPAFVNVIFGHYWSSTTDAVDTSRAWFVSFYDGHNSWFNRTGRCYVRCVRDGQ